MLNDKYFVLIIMFFAHIVDDYYLQGVLAQMKQKKWWEYTYKNLDDKYKKDYIMALATHAFSWAFVISIPLVIYNYNRAIIVFIIINTIIHSIIDDLKANKLKINLITDQSLHFIQIITTWLIYILIK